MKQSFAASNGAARYFHGDQTGSTNALTDTSGAMLTGGTAAGTRSITMHLCWETPRATTTNGGAMLTGGTTTNGGPFYYTSFGERVYYDTSSSTWKLGGEFPIGAPPRQCVGSNA